MHAIPQEWHLQRQLGAPQLLRHPGDELQQRCIAAVIVGELQVPGQTDQLLSRLTRLSETGCLHMMCLRVHIVQHGIELEGAASPLRRSGHILWMDPTLRCSGQATRCHLAA